MCAYQGVRNDNFSESFVYVLHEKCLVTLRFIADFLLRTNNKVNEILKYFFKNLSLGFPELNLTWFHYMPKNIWKTPVEVSNNFNKVVDCKICNFIKKRL